MSCPNCSHTMQKIERISFWCPRCGTLRNTGAESGRELYEAPKLVQRCRNFETIFMGMAPDLLVAVGIVKDEWRSQGVAESVRPEGDRATQ